MRSNAGLIKLHHPISPFRRRIRMRVHLSFYRSNLFQFSDRLRKLMVVFSNSLMRVFIGLICASCFIFYVIVYTHFKPNFTDLFF